MERAFREAALLIRDADGILIAAGAGMGVDSGLPDFRGKNGFWREYPVLASRGLRFGEVANAKFFRREPYLGWGFYGHRLNLYRSTTPHAGFQLLLQWISTKPLGGFVFTSNADGQFQKAGFDDKIVLECHGSIHQLQCLAPCGLTIWPVPAALPITVDHASLRWRGPLPECINCSGTARPNLLMAGGDWGWLSSRRAMREAAFTKWIGNATGHTWVILEIGAGTVARTVRDETERLSRIHGVTLIRINPAISALPERSLTVPFGALGALQSIATYL